MLALVIIFLLTIFNLCFVMDSDFSIFFVMVLMLMEILGYLWYVWIRIICLPDPDLETWYPDIRSDTSLSLISSFYQTVFKYLFARLKMAANSLHRFPYSVQSESSNPPYLNCKQLCGVWDRRSVIV